MSALTEDDKKIIKATVPILEKGGETLTRHFYSRMLRENPEVRKYFNKTSQANGTQAHALAMAVLGYAKNIDHLEALGPVATQIAQRHVALNIKPEHYPIVGTNLIHSMEEVLGPKIATPEVLEAWTKAYNQLASLLIGDEAELYQIVGDKSHGGWEDFRDFVIKQKTAVSPHIISYWLEPKDGKPVLPSQPGQYITLKAQIGDIEQRRCYSVSSAPSTKGYRITVKVIGLFSGYLDTLKEGDIVQVRPPIGTFVWDPEHVQNKGKTATFIAGGVGITPLAAMALAGAPSTLLYYAHADQDRALAGELGDLKNVKTIPVANRPTKDELKANVTSDTPVFCVGPPDFMNAVHKMLIEQGIPDKNIQFEVFGSGVGRDPHLS